MITDDDRRANDAYSSLVWLGDGPRPETYLDRAFSAHRELGQRQEREAIVAWLRERGFQTTERAVDAIAAGAHRG